MAPERDQFFSHNGGSPEVMGLEEKTLSIGTEKLGLITEVVKLITAVLALLAIVVAASVNGKTETTDQVRPRERTEYTAAPLSLREATVEQSTH